MYNKYKFYYIVNNQYLCLNFLFHFLYLCQYHHPIYFKFYLKKLQSLISQFSFLNSS